MTAFVTYKADAMWLIEANLSTDLEVLFRASRLTEWRSKRASSPRANEEFARNYADASLGIAWKCGSDEV